MTDVMVSLAIALVLSIPSMMVLIPEIVENVEDKIKARKERKQAYNLKDYDAEDVEIWEDDEE